MLAPLRDYLRPKDPMSSPLLSTTKDRYFSRLSVDIFPDNPGFKESQWIRSEDVNVEHLLDVFTSIDAVPESTWDVCGGFMDHLYWHKPRLVMLGPKIEALPDDLPSKAQCLEVLSWSFESVGNHLERKLILTHALKLRREWGDDRGVARTLVTLSDANYRVTGFLEEGIRQAKEGSEIYERLGDTADQAKCLITLAMLLHKDNQLDAAGEAASRAIDLLPEKGEQFRVCQGHRALGNIHRSKGNKEKAIHHFEVAIEIASSLSLDTELFCLHHYLSQLFSEEGRSNDAHAQLERARSHAVNHAYLLARASQLQAGFWNKQHMFEEAKSEALRALGVYEKLGATNDAEYTRELLGQIDSNARGNGR